MAAAQPRVVVFNANETMSDDAAEQIEVEGQQPAEQPAEGQQTPAEGAPPEGQQAPAQPPNKTGVVPYDRFAEVVKQRNEAQERWARLEERQKMAREEREATTRQQQEQARAATRPDPAIDPVGADLWDMREQNRQLQQNFAALQTQLTQATTGLQTNQQEQEFNNWVQYEAQSYALTNPQYYDAAKYAADWRVNWWMKLGATPEVARDIVQKESVMVAAMARQFGVKFAPAIVELATSIGWKGGQPANGAAHPAAQPPGRLQQVKAGQAMQGLGRTPAGGSEASTNYKAYTAAQIADMTEAEWSRVKANPQAWADLQVAIAASEGVDDVGRL